MMSFKKTVALCLSASMLFALVACDQTSTKKKSKDEISEDDAISVAEDYAEALIKVDAKKIEKLSKKESADKKEYLEAFDYVELYGETSAAVYEEFYKSVKYEVLEDDIEIDGDEAEVPVKFTFPDYQELEPETQDAEGWIEAIKNAEEFEEVEIEFVIVNDDDELLVKNSDKVLQKYYMDEVVNVYFYVDSFVYYDDVISGEFSQDEYEATETIEFALTCSEETKPNDKELKVEITDPSKNSIFNMSVYYNDCATYTFEVSPSDIGEDYFASGYYTITVETDDGSIYYSDFVYVNEYVEPTPTDDRPQVNGYNDYFHGFLESPDVVYSMPDPSTLGTYDEDTFTYTNDYFGVSFVAPENTYNAAEEIKTKIIANQIVDTAYVSFPTDDTKMMVACMVTNIGINIESDDDMIAFLDSCGGSLEFNGSKKIGSSTVYEGIGTDFSLDFLFVEKEGNLLVICFVGTDIDAGIAYTETMQFN